jgi:type I restriction enzyme S subunit
LEQYKKGMMQKLFSQELRFKDEQGNEFPDWEEKRLGDVATFSKGKGISKDDISENGSLECIRYGQLYTDYAETIRDIKYRINIPVNEAVLSEHNDIIIPASGETQIDIATASCVLKGGVALGGDLNIIKTKHDGVFISYYLNNNKKYDIARLAQGISVVHLYAAQLKLLQLNLPSILEQRKIADFLSSLDKKINLIATELTHAQTFKKGLLQQMFV